MKSRLVLISILILLASSRPSVRAEPSVPEALYLLSGTSGLEGALPVTLYRVGPPPASPLSFVAKISDGMQCVLVDDDRRRVVVAYPALSPTRFATMSMDSPSKIMTSQIPYGRDDLLPSAIYLLDVPPGSGVVALALGRLWRAPVIRPGKLTAVALGAQSSTMELPMEDLRYIRVGGRVGGGISDHGEIPQVRGDPMHIILADPKGWNVGIPRPPYLTSNPTTEAYPLVANNDTLAVIIGESHTLDVYNKKTSEWRHVSIPFHSNRVRAFGQWITAIAEESGWLEAESGRTAVVRKEDQSRIATFRERNPGATKRRSEVIGPKLTVDDMFGAEAGVFPGELLVYNAVSGAMFRISTGQADSEVILAVNDAVYYRVNDEIYRAEITGGKLGNSTRVAGGIEIFQIHWAFLGAEKP